MKLFNRAKGIISEDRAVEYIKRVKKYKVIERNYSNKIGEIDIIARDRNDTIIFVEVKYRTTAKFGLGREAVDNNKIFKIRNTATQYLKDNGNLDCRVRFDVVDILGDDISYIDNAF